MELTEVEFWDQYWGNCRLPSEVDLAFSFDRCLAQALRAHLPAISGECFEVGCAPGKWMAFMSKEFSMSSHGIEYSHAGMVATEKNFRMLGLTPGYIYTGDFFSTEPTRQFDVVMSFGFIEHFDEPDKVVEQHLRWLKPGGILILGVPNFRGIYYYIQRILDNTLLEKHNLSIMSTKYLGDLAIRFGLTKEFVGYIGSFEPSLPIPVTRYGTFLQICVKTFLWGMRRVRKIRALDRINHPFISSYLLGIYRKSGN
jgi:SAM-dependent methyltransferase